MAALERKFLTQLDGLTALRAIPCDPESEARWRLLTRPPGSSESAVLLARRVIGHHANRLGVFAEAEAILHYLLFRLDSLPDEA
jgi:hypothetical protein